MTDQKYMRPGFEFALAKLVEECGEVMAAVGKTQRFGHDSYNPEIPVEDRETNLQWIVREIDDLKGAIANLEREISELS